MAVLGLRFCVRAFSSCGKWGATLHHSARASHYRGLSCCGAQAPDAQAQQLWLTGPVAPRHVGSSQIRARTRVPCIGRQTLNHCATREALFHPFYRQLHQAQRRKVSYRSHILISKREEDFVSFKGQAVPTQWIWPVLLLSLPLASQLLVNAFLIDYQTFL